MGNIPNQNLVEKPLQYNILFLWNDIPPKALKISLIHNINGNITFQLPECYAEFWQYK
ncbi:MAG: hypothetical protein Q7S39_02135 [Ignavibacteria bacterium]|nr:hypothetical protein [Ignavibacteria bacterium]